MSNENDFAVFLNRLEDLIDSNQAELKRDVDRRFGSLKDELNKLKSSHSSLGHITDLLTLLAEEDNRRSLSDLPDRIRAILSSFTSNNHVHRQTHDLSTSEIGDNVSTESVNSLDELGIEGHVNGLETNVPSTGTTNDGTHLCQIDIPEGGEVLSDNQNESLSEESNETNQDISALPASPSGIPVIIKVEGSSSPQSVRVCKGWTAKIHGKYVWYCDCGSDECRLKQEIKEEFDKTEEFENNDQSVQLGNQVKEEVESGEESVIELENGDDNQNESLHEHSNGSIQRFVNDNNQIGQQVGNGDNQNESLSRESNETNQDISALAPASPSDIPVIIEVEGSSSPQSVRVCKGWTAKIHGIYMWYCDCGSDECRLKRENKVEGSSNHSSLKVAIYSKIVCQAAKWTLLALKTMSRSNNK